jgi:nucleotide-binding universal stress UspA family protein
MYKHLFVPVDGSELSHRAMDGSIALALQLGARITGFVVEPDLPLSTATRHGDEFLDRVKSHEAKNEAHATALLDQFKERAAAAGVDFTAHHVTAYQIDQSIMEEAESKGCDMIVMVTHGRNTLGEFVFGSHTKSIIARSKLPVLVLH